MIPVQVIGYDLPTGFAVYQGMEYAYYRGARIMNCSFQMTTSAGPSWMEQFMLVTPDVLYVSAAGNEQVDIDDPAETPRFPQTFTMDNLIVAGNSTVDDEINYLGQGEGSNWGATSVDVFAVGTDLIGLDPDPFVPPFNQGDGSSNSAAILSGLAALVWSEHPTWTPLQVKQKIMSSADAIPAFQGLCVSGARINAAAALGANCP